MIEVYLFHAMFALQILVLSVLHPDRLLRNVRRQLARHPATQFPRLYAIRCKPTRTACTKLA